MTLWVIWKKPIKPLIELEFEDLEDAQDIRGSTGDKGRPTPLMSASLQEIEGMKKSRSVVRNKLKLNEWHDWLVDYVPKPIKNVAGKAFLRANHSILGLYDGVRKTLKVHVVNQKQVKDNTNLTRHESEGDIYYKKIEMSFNSLMTEFFEGSNTNDLIQRMFAYIKAQTENRKFPESGFTLHKIMHLYINFHRLVLTRGGSYIELLEWIKSKKAVKQG